MLSRGKGRIRVTVSMLEFIFPDSELFADFPQAVRSWISQLSWHWQATADRVPMIC
jgi:hypothetical protein